MEDPAYRDTLVRMARIADYIKASDEDLACLFPGRDGLRELRAMAPRAHVLHTQGAAGMQLLVEGRELFQPSFPVRVADTVGAGDASMGGWIASLLTRPEAPPEAHLAFAAATAAVVCGHSGAHAPTRDEVEALLGR
jgi:fructokinase